MALSGLEFVTYDVFTNDIFCGNPLAIVKIPEDHRISQEEKQTVAKEFNLSETVFLHMPATGTPSTDAWEMDIFTLAGELPFAGHPTIGTACALVDMHPQINQATLLTKAGLIPFSVRQENGTKHARLSIPHNVHVHAAKLSQENLATLQPALKDYARDWDPHMSAVVSIVKGMTFITIKLDSSELLDMVTLSSVHCSSLIELDEDWKPSFGAPYFYVIHEDRSTSNKVIISCRMIEPNVGEDPATGSAASALCSFLALQMSKANDATEQVYDFELEQGVKMGRRSIINVRVVMKEAGKIEKVMLSGGAVKVMSGTLA